MTIREEHERREREFLAPVADKSADSKWRLRPEPEDPIRPSFQRDRDRIIHTKVFRRLKHKTQVFFSPESDHYRTRLTHTLEVTQIARSIAKVLRLHEELTEAIALGHDGRRAPKHRASTIEGQVVRVADIIAYVNHDFDDAVRAGLLGPDQMPSDLVEILGSTSSGRIGRMVSDVVPRRWRAASRRFE